MKSRDLREGWWNDLPALKMAKPKGRLSAADVMQALPLEAQHYLEGFGSDWDDIPMGVLLERSKEISGRLVLRHLNHAQEAMAQALSGEPNLDDDLYEAITNYATDGIFHLRAVLLMMVMLEHLAEDEGP